MPSIEATSRRARTYDSDRDAPAPAPPSPRDPADVAAHFNDRILYLGMNAASVAAETKALGANVTVIAGVDSGSLATAPEVRAFVQDLGARNGLSLKQCEQLEGILLGSPVSGRDELAKIAAAWAPAERGAAVPSRLVLSGHSSNGMIWGDGNTGVIHFQAVRDLGRVFPKAAAQIEDVHISGCFSEREVQESETWTKTFPNAKTIWAYGRFSPHAPTRDLADWEVATRGRTTRLTEGFVAAHGSATAWSVAGGIAHATMSIAERRQLVADADTRFDAYFSGETRIPNAHDPAADRDYGAYQMLASHREATAAERDEATAKGAQMLRLRYWDTSVRGEIASHYGSAINDALKKEGLPEVDFARLSRKEALDVIDRYRETHGSLGPIMTGIVNLTPNVIPSSFCH